MGPGDAILAGFADYHVPAGWDELKAALAESGDPGAVDAAAGPVPEAPLAAERDRIDRLFAGETSGDIWRALPPGEWREAVRRGAPLSMACTVEMLHRLGDDPTIERALEMEYRFTFRALEHADFVEGIRAQVIDKDRSPRWRHPAPDAVPAVDVSDMLRPLGEAALRLGEVT
jgi:enoyl-CoA hydratase